MTTQNSKSPNYCEESKLLQKALRKNNKGNFWISKA